MVTLYLKKHIYAHGDSFEVSDQEDKLVYTAKGDVFSQEAKLHLYNMAGNELVFINEKKSADKSTFEISINGGIFATLSKEETWKNLTYNVDSKQGKFSVSQDFSHEDFSITFNGSPFGTIKKDNNSWREAHILTLNTDDNVEFFVAMLLAIANFNDHEKEL